MTATDIEYSVRYVGPWMRFLNKITGVDEKTLRQCPPHDWENVKAVGELMICVWLYQSGLFTLVGYRLFAAAGQIRPDIVLVAIFLATFILFIDSYVIMRSGWHLSGIEELSRAGYDISGGTFARIKANVFLSVRLALATGLAQLTAIFVALLIFAGDINARIDSSYLKANAHLIAPATVLVEGAIKRETGAVTTEAARENALAEQVSALRQDEVDPSAGDPQIREARRDVARLSAQKTKADNDVESLQTFAINEAGGIKGAIGNSGRPGHGPRWHAAMDKLRDAKARDQDITKQLNDARTRLDLLQQQAPAANSTIEKRSHAQLPGFEQALKAENAKLANMKKDLAKLVAGREDAIRKAVDSAPDHVNYDDGFLAQLRILETIAHEDKRIAAVIFLIDFVAFGFELAAVLSKVTSYVPTTYAALLARDAFITANEIANEIEIKLEELDNREGKDPNISRPEQPFADSEIFGPNLVPDQPNGAGDQPPKRKRGRPRKHPLSPIKGANGTGNPEQGPDQEGPV